MKPALINLTKKEAVDGYLIKIEELNKLREFLPAARWDEDDVIQIGTMSPVLVHLRSGSTWSWKCYNSDPTAIAPHITPFFGKGDIFCKLRTDIYFLGKPEWTMIDSFDAYVNMDKVEAFYQQALHEVNLKREAEAEIKEISEYTPAECVELLESGNFTHSFLLARISQDKDAMTSLPEKYLYDEYVWERVARCRLAHADHVRAHQQFLAQFWKEHAHEHSYFQSYGKLPTHIPAYGLLVNLTRRESVDAPGFIRYLYEKIRPIPGWEYSHLYYWVSGSVAIFATEDYRLEIDTKTWQIKDSFLDTEYARSLHKYSIEYISEHLALIPPRMSLKPVVSRSGIGSRINVDFSSYPLTFAQ